MSANGGAFPREEIEVPLDKDGLAPWAVKDTRYNPDDLKEIRSVYKHDSDEIIYSAAFRRLSDKSQVVVKPESIERFRSRLTHTLEVNQIAESIGSRLRLNGFLVNAIAFGHDIGHTPFGHAGERQFQEIMRSDVLPLCDPTQLRENLSEQYGVKITFKETGECENIHWLFHHALNSVRVARRKLKGISKPTTDGVMTHSWSPWTQKPPKFGVPFTYEAQAVAIADQLASINHDTEDILGCRESMYDEPDKLRSEFPEWVSQRPELKVKPAEANQILDDWFLKQGPESNDRNGWGRKYRLRTIVNDVALNSARVLVSQNVDSCDKAHDVPLSLRADYGNFLFAYEQYLREHIIGRVSWFKQRDAQAAAEIWTVYNFYKHYARSPEQVQNIRPQHLQSEVREAVAEFDASHKDDAYGRDEHFNTFIKSAKDGKYPDLVHILKTVDYVSGMTDRFLMKNYEVAFRLFR